MMTEMGLLLLLVFVLSTSAFPFNQPRYTENGGLIDCNDVLLVEKLNEAKIAYSCLPNSFLLGSMNDPTLNEVNIGGGDVGGLAVLPIIGDNGGEIALIIDEPIREENIDIMTTDCINPQKCGPVSEIFESVCPLNEVFVSEIGQCLPMPPATNERREGYFNPNLEALNGRECEDGYVFDLKTGMCQLDKKIFSVSPTDKMNTAPLESSISFVDVKDCIKGTIFAAEVGLCLPVRPEVIESKPQNTEPARTVVIQPSSIGECPPGTVFSPEIDLCMSVDNSKPIDAGKPERVPEKLPEALALISDSQPSGTSDKLSAWTDKSKCPKGTIYNYEIDLCLPIHSERPQGDDPASVISDKETVEKTTEDPFRPTLTPLTPDQIGGSKCKKGQVYVSEIDFCLNYP